VEVVILVLPDQMACRAGLRGAAGRVDEYPSIFPASILRACRTGPVPGV